MPAIEFGCRATIIGSMPHTDPKEACSLITRYLRDFPAWPQLPQRSPLENMYVQFSEGFPGVVPARESGVCIDHNQDWARPLAELLTAYDEEKDIDKYAISPDYAAGLHAFLELKNLAPLAVSRIPKERDCECAHALATAIVTIPEAIPPEVKKKLALIIGKYVK